MDVLVTDGHQRATLAVVRSLGKHGLKVTVGEECPGSLAATSRYATGQFVYPSPTYSPDQFQQALIEFCRSNKHTMLIPMTDMACTLVDEIRDQLRPLTIIAMADSEAYARASDKQELIRIAESISVPVPPAVPANDLNELQAASEHLDYPVVLKPALSRRKTPDGWVIGAVEYAYSATELLSKYERLSAEGHRLLIQQRIKGPGVGLFALCEQGETKLMFAHRRLREKPPSGGVSVLRESTSVDEQTGNYARKLLKALRWDGVAMVEFKIDAATNQPMLIEINGRFWGSLQLAIDAGVDFPRLLYNQLCGTALPIENGYKVGVTSRWLLGDLDHLLMLWLRRRTTLSLPNGYAGRWKVLVDFIASFFGPVKHEIWRLDDLRPALTELGRYLRINLRAIWSRIR